MLLDLPPVSIFIYSIPPSCICSLNVFFSRIKKLFTFSGEDIPNSSYYGYTMPYPTHYPSSLYYPHPISNLPQTPIPTITYPRYTETSYVTSPEQRMAFQVDFSTVDRYVFQFSFIPLYTYTRVILVIVFFAV